MNPKANLWEQIPQQAAGVLNPPLRGIVQLTNSAALRFRNWSFNNKNAPISSVYGGYGLSTAFSFLGLL